MQRGLVDAVLNESPTDPTFDLLLFDVRSGTRSERITLHCVFVPDDVWDALKLLSSQVMGDAAPVAV